MSRPHVLRFMPARITVFVAFHLSYAINFSSLDRASRGHFMNVYSIVDEEGTESVSPLIGFGPGGLFLHVMRFFSFP